MSSKKSISILIGIIGILLVLLAGSIGYIFGTSNLITNESVSKSNGVDDAKVMKEIEELKALYDSKIEQKTVNYNELQNEKAKVENLVFELEKTKNNANSLLKYKTEYKALESKMKVLVNEIVVLKNKKTRISIQPTKPLIAKTENKPKIDNAAAPIVVSAKKEVATVYKPEPVKPKSDDFFAKKESPKTNVAEVVTKPAQEVKKAPTVKFEKFAKVTISSVKVAAYNLKSDAKQIETNVSSKADLIKIHFTVDGNSAAKSGEKNYYIQIINTNNNVVGKRITEYFDNETLTYSLSKSINYNNQSTDCSIDFPYNKFEKGTYFINIFDRNDLVGKSSFTLK
ncbi:hypothetical protein OX283_014210 [Flavobacterium sp. SUN052]|uniref:hypothetical protein n=1 Tax=Flavobacterium sp. SUN052 TaxID=3002441 RepID=UPI00237E741C|nr:hypothetical protein [Flavobacterium sp. SUN052]MEC4005821.1 hypothetical protein [Flavobacterium sp. SUN052]